MNSRLQDRDTRGEPSKPLRLELSVVMPCLNEHETIGVCIRKAKQFIEKQGIQGEIVIGDNGSTDGSQDLARELGARVIDVKERGYGAALQGAIEGSHGRYVIMGDSDDSYDFAKLMPFVEKLREGYDLVMGNRFLGCIKPGAMPWKNRCIGNPILTGIGKLFFRSKCSDFHCGLRGFCKDAYLRMALQTKGMEFASEMVIKATLLNMKMVEVPITLSPDGRSRHPHLRPWRDGWRHLRFMLLYSPRWLFLIPGAMLFALNLLATIRLFVGPLVVFDVAFDVNSMVFTAIGMLIGLQSIAFALLTKVYAIGHGLLPFDKKFNAIFQYVNLEKGLICGLILILLGVGGTFYAVLAWKATGFGALNPRETTRTVILSAFPLAIGVQVIFYSFFMSILGLKIKSNIPSGNEGS